MGVGVLGEIFYQALETLRLERELGQVDDAEYERQAGEYRRMAALLVREQEQLLAERASDEPDAADDAGLSLDAGSSYDALEREVAEARERLRRMEDDPQ
ncbi:MAG: hypothetical protein OXK21_01595 [Chloroflexota bacterium]|nr:hypothetical protein [Chloroflexota bacterium]